MFDLSHRASVSANGDGVGVGRRLEHGILRVSNAADALMKTTHPHGTGVLRAMGRAIAMLAQLAPFLRFGPTTHIILIGKNANEMPSLPPTPVARDPIIISKSREIAIDARINSFRSFPESTRRTL